MRSMDTSDPIISSLSLTSRLRKRRRLTLPQRVIDLLAFPDDQEISSDDSDGEAQDSSGVPEVIMHLDELEISDSDSE